MGQRQGLSQLSDPAKLQPIVDDVLDNNQQSIDDFKNGKTGPLGSSWVKSWRRHVVS